MPSLKSKLVSVLNKAKGFKIEPTKGNERYQFCAFFEKPGRIEVTIDPKTGHFIAFLYEGTKIDLDQEATILFDNDIGDELPKYRIGGSRKTYTYKMAIAKSKEIWNKTGVVVSIEEVK